MYSMWKIICFFNLKPHKHIALHQIMFFLAMSYDPFNLSAPPSTFWPLLWFYLLFWDAVFLKAEVKRTMFLRYHECVINHFSGEQRVTIHQRAVSSPFSLSCLHLTYKIYTGIKKIKKNDRTIFLWVSAHKNTDSSQTSVNVQNSRLSYFHFFTVNYHSNIWGQ